MPRDGTDDGQPLEQTFRRNVDVAVVAPLDVRVPDQVEGVVVEVAERLNVRRAQGMISLHVLLLRRGRPSTGEERRVGLEGV